MKQKIKSYAFFILSALAVGGLSAFFTRNNMDINKDVLMPPLSPPPILFPIVWTILFILMGISAAMIYNSNAPKSQKNSALLVYTLSLAVNFSWNVIFFNLRAFGFAFFWLLLLLLYILDSSINGIYKVSPSTNEPSGKLFVSTFSFVVINTNCTICVVFD